MKLRCVSRYSAAGVVFEAGAVLECDVARGEWLMRDAPSCFEVVLEGVGDVRAYPGAAAADSTDDCESKGKGKGKGKG